jgi:hypothetical protein
MNNSVTSLMKDLVTSWVKDPLTRLMKGPVSSLLKDSVASVMKDSVLNQPQKIKWRNQLCTDYSGKIFLYCAYCNRWITKTLFDVLSNILHALFLMLSDIWLHTV